jgi:hypothetical protein
VDERKVEGRKAKRGEGEVRPRGQRLKNVAAVNQRIQQYEGR